MREEGAPGGGLPQRERTVFAAPEETAFAASVALQEQGLR